MNTIVPFPVPRSDRAPTIDPDALDAALFDAHGTGDRSALVDLYSCAAETTNDRDAAAFYLTHAYIFALESGSARTDGLLDQLVALGREARRRD
ncbi:MAG: hypothetical protein AAGB05_14280 [Pseudomonadota bacterium]